MGGAEACCARAALTSKQMVRAVSSTTSATLRHGEVCMERDGSRAGASEKGGPKPVQQSLGILRMG